MIAPTVYPSPGLPVGTAAGPPQTLRLLEARRDVRFRRFFFPAGSFAFVRPSPHGVSGSLWLEDEAGSFVTVLSTEEVEDAFVDAPDAFAEVC